MTILSNQNYALMGLHHSVKLPSIIQFPSGLKKSSWSTFYQVWTGCERAHPTTRNATFPYGMRDTSHDMRFARWLDFGKLDSRRDAAPRKFSLHQSLSLFFRAAVRYRPGRSYLQAPFLPYRLRPGQRRLP